jgi:transposase InsO family protein
MARSTVDGVLARHGLNRLAHTDRASGAVVRYQREHPGELVHLDVKKLGRIPEGGGHRAHGRAEAARGRGIGYDYLHSAIDDRSRVAFSQVLPDETATTCARFLVEAAGVFADHGVRIERVLTDNAKAYTESVLFAETAAGLGIRLKRTRRYRPQTNGKVERFHKTLLEEWAYARLYAATPNVAAPWLGGCASPITGDHTPRSPASRRWRSSSTTLVGTTLGNSGGVVGMLHIDHERWRPVWVVAQHDGIVGSVLELLGCPWRSGRLSGQDNALAGHRSEDRSEGRHLSSGAERAQVVAHRGSLRLGCGWACQG